MIIVKRFVARSVWKKKKKKKKHMLWIIIVQAWKEKLNVVETGVMVVLG